MIVKLVTCEFANRRSHYHVINCIVVKQAFNYRLVAIIEVNLLLGIFVKSLKPFFTI